MRRSRSAFTLIELLITISIIAMLMTLLAPALGRALEKAQSTQCAGNLHQIGVAVQNYANDHDGRLPEIESMPTSPVYTGDDKPGGMFAVLGDYGVTTATLKCPTDLKGPNNYAKEQTSYMWRPLVDDELINAPKIYTRRGEIVPPLSRLALATDFEGKIHAGHINCVFADGHVRTF